MKKLIAVTLLSVSTNVFAVDTWTNVQAGSYTIFTNQILNAHAAYHVKIYNPTDNVITGRYTAYVCAERNESNCSKKQNSKQIQPKQWMDEKFDLHTPVSYDRQGIYKLTASINAEGVEKNTNTQYGTITVYNR